VSGEEQEYTEGSYVILPDLDAADLADILTGLGTAVGIVAFGALLVGAAPIAGAATLIGVGITAGTEVTLYVAVKLGEMDPAEAKRRAIAGATSVGLTVAGYGLGAAVSGLSREAALCIDEIQKLRTVTGGVYLCPELDAMAMSVTNASMATRTLYFFVSGLSLVSGFARTPNGAEPHIGHLSPLP